MRIERINYQKVFPAGSYLTERIGFEASLEEGEDQRAAIELMRQMAEDSHREKYPQYYVNGLPKIDPPHPQAPSIQLQKEIEQMDAVLDAASDLQKPKPHFSRSQARLVKLIESTKDLTELAKFKADAHKEGISYVYMARVKYFNQQLLTQ